MLNIFRMHMYRVSKAKSTIVLAIVMIACLFIRFGLAHLVFDDPLNLEFVSVFASGNSQSSALTPSQVNTWCIQASNSLIICLTIFSVIFANCDFTRGFAKNTYSLYKSRTPLVMGKWASLMTCITAVYVVFSFFSLAFCALLLPAFESKRWGEYIRGWIVLYILLISLMTLVFFITNRFKSPAGGMVIGILIATGTFQTVERLIDVLIARASGESLLDAFAGKGNAFRLSDYCLDNVYISYNPSMGSGDTVRTILVALVYGGLALFLAVWLSKKQDVRC